MTRKEILNEAVIVTGTVGMAGVLFFMAVYELGVIAVAPGSIVLLILLLWFSPKMTNTQSVFERISIACLAASQVSLFIAVVVDVAPTLAAHV